MLRVTPQSAARFESWKNVGKFPERRLLFGLNLRGHPLETKDTRDPESVFHIEDIHKPRSLTVYILLDLTALCSKHGTVLWVAD